VEYPSVKGNNGKEKEELLMQFLILTSLNP
jgi:hypothetical protein